MENKTGNNMSSGAEKVETVESYTAQEASSAAKRKSPKKTGKTVSKAERAEKREKSAAKKRVAAAKKELSEKEKKVQRRADLKRAKLERKAALKEKKLEKKAALAQKKADRKAKKAERKAAIKERRVERRAEKIARRELLRNESKTERAKRIEREKREKLALKRQRKEAREKARENKLKAREAAHARKAEDRKHRREQRTARKENRRGFGGWLAAVISLGVACLALATVVTAGAFRMNDMALEAEGGARATLYELVSVSEDMDRQLDKLRVSSGVEEQRKLLTDLMVDAAVMELDLERIPVDAATGTDMSGFVNKTGACAREMLARLASGKTLTQAQKQTLAQLYEINSKLSRELNSLVTGMSAGDLRNFMSGNDSTMSEGFGQMGEGLRGDAEEIAKAPFAGGGNVGKNRLSELDEITEAQAEELASKYFAAYHIAEVRYSGETTAKQVTCYDFVLTDESGNEIFAQITKNGGKLAFFDTYETCTEKNFDLDTCDDIATEFLKGLGIKDLEAVWLSDAGMVADITYVTEQDDVRIYPEAIRIRVCESKGRVVGMDARDYLLNNADRRKVSAGISMKEAKALLTEGLEVTSSELAVIPLGGKEVLCYEFACTYGEEQYIVYLDAVTGAEVQVFRVRQSARGNYLD